jgi:hypothetical protein
VFGLRLVGKMFKAVLFGLAFWLKACFSASHGACVLQVGAQPWCFVEHH